MNLLSLPSTGVLTAVSKEGAHSKEQAHCQHRGSLLQHIRNQALDSPTCLKKKITVRLRMLIP